MKESTLYNETGNAEKYTPSIESIKKSLNKIHFTNEELAQNLINKTQNLLNNSYNYHVVVLWDSVYFMFYL